MAPQSKCGATLALPIASKVPPELMLLPLSKPPAETISMPPKRLNAFATAFA